MEFDNTSQEIWEDMRAGTPFAGPKRDEGDYKEDFYGLFREEFVDYDKLENFVVQAMVTQNKRFNYRDYAVEMGQYFNHNINHPLIALKYLAGNGGFSYLDNNRKKRVASISIQLNRRVDDISPSSSHWITIDGSSATIKATFRLYYAGTESKRKPIPETASETDFTIESKYLAIAISTTVLEDFFVLYKNLLGNSDTIKQKSVNLFVSELKKAKASNTIAFLYNHIPASIQDKIGVLLGEKLMLTHLYALKSADDANWFSDESGPILKILQMMANGNPVFLYNFFIDHPRLVKELYYNMHNESRINGVNYPNRMLFANLMLVLGLLNGYKGMKKTGHVYRIGKGYVPDSNVDETNDKYRAGIFLKQYVAKSRDIKLYERLYRVAINGKVTEDVAVTNGQYYLPMSPLKWIDLNAEDATPSLVPAIFIKYIADTEEWEDIMHYVRIGMDILAVILGVLSLGAASGLVFALAVADIGLSSADALIALNDDLFKQTPEGRAFLEIWDKIMFVGGIVTAGPLLIRGAFKKGVSVMRLAKNETTKKLIQESLSTLIKEVNASHPFIKQSFVFLDTTEELIKASNSAFKASFINKLLEVDVTFLGRIDNATQQAKNEFAVVYEGQIIASGNARAIMKRLKKLENFSGTKLTAKLEEFITFNGRGKYHVKGFLESEELTAQEILAWERKFKLLAGVNFRLKSASHNRAVLKYMEKEKSLAFFEADTKPPIVWYKDTPTNYILQHEYYHVEEFIIIKPKEYLKGVNGTIEERFHNTIMREKYVYQKILENKHLFSDAELRHARGNYQYYLKLAIKADVEIISEYTVKID